MHRFSCLFILALSSFAAQAVAQIGGAPSGGPASSPGAATPNPPATRSVGPAPAPGSRSSAPSSTLNTDGFPPSRLLPSPSPTTAAPGQQGGPAIGAPASGAPAGLDPNLPATSSGARPQPGGANSSEQSARTGKNPINERYADCVKLWDRDTHMSRADWSRTCRRIENRLQNLQVESLDIDVSGPKPRKTDKSGGRG
jgi:hypothetical protein